MKSLAQQLVAVTILLALPAVAGAQKYWEMTPYQMAVYLAIDPTLAQGSRLSADLSADIIERTDNYVGAAWSLSIEPAKGELRQSILTDLARLNVETFGTLPEKCDKLVALAVSTTPAGEYRITAREFDIRTQTWGNIAERTTRQAALLSDDAFQVLWQAFAPIAQIEVDAEKHVTIRPRAGGLRLRDPQLQFLHTGDIFRPLVRKVDRQGKTAKSGVQALPWTYLLVDKVEGTRADCQIQSGLRQSLGGRRRGQSEQLAIAVRPTGSSTRLTVQSRAKPPQFLAGYDVYAQKLGSKTTTFLGRTDVSGAIEIPATDEPIRVLYLKGGGILLARLPMVPGLEPTATAEVADDDVRLALEGYLTARRDDMIDLVARREILMARARNRMQSGNVEAAEKFYDELRRLPTREQISFAITEEKARNATQDPAVQAKIEKLSAETLKLVNRFLDPRPLDALRSELNKAKKTNPTATDSAEK